MSRRISDAAHTTVPLPLAGRYIAQDPVAGITEKFDAGILVQMSASRALSSTLISDGATANRAVVWTPGAAGAVAGQAISIPFEFDVPTSNPAVNWVIKRIGTSSTGASYTAANSLDLVLEADGSLNIAMVTDGSNSRSFRWSGFRAAYSGVKGLRGAFVLPGNASTAPVGLLQGVDLSANFTGSTGGTPPNWMPLSLVATYIVDGINSPAGRFVPHAPILGALSAAEVSEWTQTGRLPTWCEKQTGSATNLVTGDSSTFTSGIGSLWTAKLSGTIVATGGKGVITPAVGGYYSGATLDITLLAGVHYRLAFTLSDLAGTGTPLIGISTGVGVTVHSGVAAAGNCVLEVSSPVDSKIFFSGAGTLTSFALDDVSLSICGPLFRPVIPASGTRIEDAGSNNIVGTLTAGITSSVTKFTAQHVVDWAAAHGPYINARAMRPGMAFDGTAGNRVYALLGAAGAIGTDDFSETFYVSVPTTAPSAAMPVFSIGPSATEVYTPRQFSALIDSAGLLIVVLYGASTASERAVTCPLISAHAGKVVAVTIARAGTVLVVYINGVAQPQTLVTSSLADFGQTVTSTYLLLGGQIIASANTLKGRIYGAFLYNLALSQSDVTEIYELGGAVPERLKWTSQVARIANTFDNEIVGWNGFNGATLTANAGYATLAGASNRDTSVRRSMGASYIGRRIRISIEAKTATTGSLFVVPYSGAATPLPTSSAWTTLTWEINGDGSENSPGICLFATGGVAHDVRNFSIKQLGCVCSLACDDGIGYQLHDASTNKLDAVMTTSGVTHLIPQRRGYVRGALTWAGTHEAKSLLGQRSFPNGYVLTDPLTIKATAGSSGSGATAGVVSNAGLFAGPTAYTTSKKRLAITGFGEAAGITDSDCNLVLDPDAANYTGSIQVEAHYAVTEGNP